MLLSAHNSNETALRGLQINTASTQPLQKAQRLSQHGWDRQETWQNGCRVHATLAPSFAPCSFVPEHAELGRGVQRIMPMALPPLGLLLCYQNSIHTLTPHSRPKLQSWFLTGFVLGSSSPCRKGLQRGLLSSAWSLWKEKGQILNSEILGARSPTVLCQGECWSQSPSIPKHIWKTKFAIYVFPASIILK